MLELRQGTFTSAKLWKAASTLLVSASVVQEFSGKDTSPAKVLFWGSCTDTHGANVPRELEADWWDHSVLLRQVTSCKY